MKATEALQIALNNIVKLNMPVESAIQLVNIINAVKDRAAQEEKKEDGTTH